MGERSTQNNKSNILQTISTAGSIQPSRRQTQESQPISHKILGLYNIHDYLPPSDDSTTFKYIPSVEIDNRRPTDINFMIKSHTESGNYTQSKYIEMTQLLQNTEKQKDSLKEQNQCLLQKIDKLNSQLSQKNELIQQKTKQLDNLNKKYNEEIVTMQQQQQKQKKKKQNNIRIFCQKYELIVHPKIKHSYTVEVQTHDTDLTQPKEFGRNLRISSLSTDQHNVPQPSPPTFTQWNNNNNLKANYYQMYQSKMNPHGTELSNQPTTRSQVFQTANKLTRPKFMDSLPNDSHKIKLSNRIDTIENDRNRSNLLNNKPTEKIRNEGSYKIKEEELQIYPIEDEHLQDVIQGVLAYLR